MKANADYMAEHLATHGWQYVVVDIQWYRAQGPGPRLSIPTRRSTMDGYGRLLPAPNRFPSSRGGVQGRSPTTSTARA